MQTVVGAYEAEMNFSALLDKVIQGETITITLHGVPVADMHRHNEYDPDDAEIAIAEIMELREEFARTFKGENIKALIEEGRR